MNWFNSKKEVSCTRTFCHSFFHFILPAICVSTGASKLSRGTSITTTTNLLQLTQRGGAITLFKICMLIPTSKSPCGNFNNLQVNLLKHKCWGLSKHRHAYSQWQAMKRSISQQSHKFIIADTRYYITFLQILTYLFCIIFLGFTYCWDHGHYTWSVWEQNNRQSTLASQTPLS